VTDTLPSVVTFTNSTINQSGNNNSIYWWIIPSINVNESIVIRINVTVDEGFSGTITNKANITSDSHDPEYGNNTDEETLIVSKKSSGGGGSPIYDYSPPEDDFKDPTAKTDGPYYALVNEEIQFNASDSHDNDEDGESIERFDWKFFDEDVWHNDTGATPTFTYIQSGIYNISLRVFDNEGQIDINTTYALIIKPNSPPNKPEIIGPQNGTINVSYNFTIVSTDEDGDEIKYIINWADGKTSESMFLPSGVPFNTNHRWIEPGLYKIYVTAFDNSTETTNELTIEIIEPEPKHMPTKTKENDFPILLLLLFLLMLILLLILLAKRRKDKKEEQKKSKAAVKAK
jgi:hypothetical protein